MSQTVSVLVLPGCVAASCAGFADTLAIANRIFAQVQSSAAALFTIQYVAMAAGPVVSSSGLPLQAESGLDGLKPGGVVYIPGFSVASGAEVDSLLHQHSDLIEWLATAPDSLLVSNCSGAFLLAEAGVLEGKSATTAWWLHTEFASRYRNISLDRDAMLVRATDTLITSAGTTAYFDAALALIEQFADRFLARTVAKYLMLENQRPSQSPYTILSAAECENQLVARAEVWIRAHLAEDFRLEALAEQLAVSPRTLIRHFQAAMSATPQAFIQKLRIEKCKVLLETTALDFKDIVARCGYRDESAFRRVFTRQCQMSPRQYRLRFSRHQAERR